MMRCLLAAMPPSNPEFRATVELLLFGLGGMMTLGIIGVTVWLLRQMLREEREAEAQRKRLRERKAP